jgi:3-mercaptopyruvate sulfurtransferase SseA
MLIDRGFKLVRPLAGGLEAWENAGYEVESEPLIAIGITGSYTAPPRPAPTEDAANPEG